jgi:glutamyl-tRNA reductase
VTAVTCLSVTGCQAGLPLLERLTFRRDDLAGCLPRLRARAGASGVTVLSTCQRVEVYATSPDLHDPRRLVAALAAERDVRAGVLDAAAAVRTGPDAVRHLLRVTAGLTSFVLGEREIVGQVRTAAEESRAAGVTTPELDRLLAAAVSASRRVHRETSFAAAGQSVAAAAVDAAAAHRGGGLVGCRLLVVGAGEVATVAIRRGVALGAEVTVANRTMRRAERLRNAGARVVDLGEMEAELAHTDLAILATAAPHALVDRGMLRSARGEAAPPLLLLDLSMPRNVDPSAREVDGVDVLDLDDLRRLTPSGAGGLASEVDLAERLVDHEAARYLRWLATRSAAAAVRRLRADADAVAYEEARRVARQLPAGLQDVVEKAVLRTARRLAHGATTGLLQAAEQGDDDLVAALSEVFGRPDTAVDDAGPQQPPAPLVRPRAS